VAAAGLDPVDFVSHLVEVGPRSWGSAEHRVAQVLLLQDMERAGLLGVERLPTDSSSRWQHLTGVLSGRSSTETVLTAHYDTVQGSRGVLDNASGCAATLSAASHLSKVPLAHMLRVVLTDGEEEQAAGTRAWLAKVSPQDRELVLANLNVDMVGSSSQSGPGIVHLTAGWIGNQKLVSPAWLVHAVLRGAEASSFPVVVLDGNWSWFAQLAVRCSMPSRLSDSRRFLESEVPSVTISDLPLTSTRSHEVDEDEDLGSLDPERLRGWALTLAAIARRLDSLEGRPAGETEYLVLGGRVWIRRDLIWVGFVVWVLSVWRGLPGPWRRRDSMTRRQAGRSYLPGFAFRMLFILAVFLIPTFAAILLYPVGVLALLGTRDRTRSRLTPCFLAVTPTVLFILWLAYGQMAGWFTLDRSALLPATLVLLNLATFCSWQLDPFPDRERP